MELPGNICIDNEKRFKFPSFQNVSCIQQTRNQYSNLDPQIMEDCFMSSLNLSSTKNFLTPCAGVRKGLKNNFTSKHMFGQSSFLPGFSHLVGGFVGSKCLIGSSTNREYGTFWDKVFSQLCDIIETSQKNYTVTSSAPNCLGFDSHINTAFILSQSYNLLNDSGVINCQPNLDARIDESCLNSISKMGKSEDLNNFPKTTSNSNKQSYADVTKSLITQKMPEDTAVKAPVTNLKFACKPSHETKSIIPLHVNDDICWRERKETANYLSRNGKPSEEKYYNERYPKKYHRCQAVSLCKHSKTFSPQAKVSSANFNRKPLTKKQTKHPLNSSKAVCSRKGKNEIMTEIRDGRWTHYDYNNEPVKDINNGNTFFKWRNRLNNNDNGVGGKVHCKNWRCRPSSMSLCEVCEVNRGQIPSSAPINCDKSKLQHCNGEIDKTEDNTLQSVQFCSPPKRERSSSETSSGTLSSSIESGILVSALNCRRRRLSSECSVDSEDSFVIVFDGSGGRPESSESDSEDSDEWCDESVQSSDFDSEDTDCEDEVRIF